MKIALIGFGNVGYALAAGLHNDYSNKISFFKHNFNVAQVEEGLKKRLDETKADYCPDYESLIKDAAIIFACVVGKNTLDVASKSAPYLKKGQIYVDLNTAPPQVKLEAAKLVEASGAQYVDGVIMGPVEKLGHKVPILASGGGAEDFEKLFTPLEMQITTMQGQAGAAASVKLIRSIFQKGLTSLLQETLMAARAFGSQEQVLQSLAATIDAVPFATLAEHQTVKGLLNAKRMSHEVNDCLEMLQSNNLSDFMTKGTLASFTRGARIAEEKNLQNTTVLTIDEALALIQEQYAKDINS